MRKAGSLVAFLCVLLGASSVLAQAPQQVAPVPYPQPAAPAAPTPSAEPQPVAPAAAVQAPPPGPVQPVQAAPGQPIGYWPVARGVSEDMYRRNRSWAIAGKVLTAIAPILFMTAVAAAWDYETPSDSSEAVALAASALVVGTAGRVTWAACDLRLSNHFDRGGVRIRRGAAITATVAASLSWIPYVNFVATPATWIAGGIASARIRDAHDQTSPMAASVMPYSMHSKRGFTTGFTLKF